MDDPLTDDPVTTRAARWFQASPAELVGLAVLVVGAVAASGLLWFQATQRPAELPNHAGSVGAAADPSRGDDPSQDDDGATPGATPPDHDGHADAADAQAGIGGGGAHDAADGDVPEPGGSDASPAGPDAPSPAASPAGPDAPSPAAPQPDAEVAVHVTGAVTTPGLVVLPEGGRVADAVTAAGGLTDEAVTELINLARVLVDGEHVHVPVDGEELPPLAASPPSGPAAGAPAGGPPGEGAPDSQGPIDVNHASATELETLPGIGPARAEAIVAYREEHGPFDVPGDLRGVTGIGEAIFQGLADLVTTG